MGPKEVGLAEDEPEDRQRPAPSLPVCLLLTQTQRAPPVQAAEGWNWLVQAHQLAPTSRSSGLTSVTNICHGG